MASLRKKQHSTTKIVMIEIIILKKQFKSLQKSLKNTSFILMHSKSS